MTEAVKGSDKVSSAIRARCKNPGCTKLLYSGIDPKEGHFELPQDSATCSLECFQAWQESKKDGPDADKIKDLTFKPLTMVDILEPSSDVGVVQGNWKVARVYIDRVETAADTASLEAHVQSRTVKGTEIWPIQRPTSHFEMLLQDVKVDYTVQASN